MASNSSQQAETCIYKSRDLTVDERKEHLLPGNVHRGAYGNRSIIIIVALAISCCIPHHLPQRREVSRDAEGSLFNHTRQSAD